MHEHALMHGLSEEQVLHAWRNAVSVARRGCESGEVDFVAIGFDQHGRAIEMTGRIKSFGVLIFHANTPSTTRALKELGLGGGRSWLWSLIRICALDSRFRKTR